VVAGQPARALVINIDAPGLSGTPALDAFERAADAWEAVFTDPVQVNIAADLRPFGSTSIIGQASSVVLGAPYDLIRDAVVLDGLAEPDDAVVAYLPRASEFSAFVLIGLTANLSATKANLKALGFDPVALDGNFGATDATIEFNSEFAFDFDRSDGISPGRIDFETVAAHEIGHALGFTSDVDTVDALLAAGFLIPSTPRTLDLFRFPANAVPGSPAEFTTAPRLLVPGIPNPFTFEDQFPAVFADLDDVFPMSTGAFFGDGRQASHWKDNDLTGSLLGIMDPTLAFGQIIDVAAADIRALDVIGWDFAPDVAEPASVLLAAFGLLLAFRQSRRRGRQARVFEAIS
jgi:hypothetical protein